MRFFKKTVSEKQLVANRANAQKSTGPRSPETQAKVSQNRTTHGLCGKLCALGGDRRKMQHPALLSDGSAFQGDALRIHGAISWSSSRS